MEFIFTLEQLPQAARKVLQQTGKGVLAFYGSMGAGKTTLIKAMLKELGAGDPGSSPTFGIVNEYHTRTGELLAYHFDFYRLEDETEALDLGLEDYLAQDAWIFMEWPEKIENLLPEDAISVKLEVIDPVSRKLIC